MDKSVSWKNSIVVFEGYLFIINVCFKCMCVNMFMYNKFTIEKPICGYKEMHNFQGRTQEFFTGGGPKGGGPDGSSLPN